MTKYRVKLIDGHKAKPEQNVDGYLGDNGENVVIPLPLTYTRGEAIKKAAAFKGKIEKVETTVHIVPMRIGRISKEALVWGVEKELNKILPEFKDTNKELAERIFTGDVFDNILNGVDNLDEKAIAQLQELVNEFREYEYVLVTG